jgi:hypothetical protein
MSIDELTKRQRDFADHAFGALLDQMRDPWDKQRFSTLKEDLWLFDLDSDPGERTNLADDPDYANIVADLIREIDTWEISRTMRKPTLTEKIVRQLQDREVTAEPPLGRQSRSIHPCNSICPNSIC